MLNVTSTVHAVNLDPGGGIGVAKVDVTVTFRKLMSLEDTDHSDGSGLAYGGADIWLKASLAGYSDCKSGPPQMDFFEGLEDHMYLVLPPYPWYSLKAPYDSGPERYFQAKFTNIVLDSSKDIHLTVYDRDLFWFNQKIIETILTIKPVGSTGFAKTFSDICAIGPDLDFSNSYIEFGYYRGTPYRVHYYTGSSLGWMTTEYYPGLQITVTMIYH